MTLRLPVSSEPLLTLLADLCREHPTRSKCVVMRSLATGVTLGERLARESTSWLNLRFTTPWQLALRTAAPWLVEQGLDPTPEDLGPALVMRLLRELPPGTPEYFRKNGLADHPAMGAALWRVIREMRMCGLGPDTGTSSISSARPPEMVPVPMSVLSRAAFTSAGKHAELSALLTAYERELETKRMADAAILFEAAARHAPMDGPVTEGDFLVFEPDVRWTRLEQQFLDALPGERRPVPKLGKVPASGTVPSSSSSTPLAHILAPASTVPVSGIELFLAGSRDAEIDEVFRRIAASGTPLDEAEIVAPGSIVALMVREKALRLGWPVTIECGIPAGLTRPGRALLGWCDWVEGGLRASKLRQLLHTGDIALELPDESSPGQCARVLVKAEATSGRATYDSAPGALARRWRDEARDPEADEDRRDYLLERATRAEHFRDWCLARLAFLPEPTEEGVSVATLATAAADFVRTSVATLSPEDGAARIVLGDACQELSAIGTLKLNAREALAFVRQAVDGATVSRGRPQPGALHVSLLMSAGIAGRRAVFLIGLEEGAIFRAPLEDPVLLDDERERIHPSLPRSRDRLDDTVRIVLSRLAALPGPVTLSCTRRDVREYRDLFPSWLMLHAFRLRFGDPSASHLDLDAHLGEPVSVVPKRDEPAITEVAWWLSGLRDARQSGRGDVMKAFPWLEDGERAVHERSQPKFGRFDGHVPRAERHDPRRTGRAVSASYLELLAGCPYHFFLEKLLRIEALEEEDADEDVWLTPKLKGSELHALYAEMVRLLRNERRGIDLARDAEWLRARATERLDVLRVEMPPPSEAVFDREKAGILGDGQRFVEWEAKRGDRTPVALEVGFGMDDVHPEVEPLARTEPVPIPLGKGERLHVRGRIDRIDRLGTGERKGNYEVVDYKTGYFAPESWAGVFNGGRRLQHALYGMAARDLLSAIDDGAKVEAGSYYFTGERGGGERVRIPAPSTAAVGQVLNGLLDTLAAGAFLHTDDEGDCRYCDLERACLKDHKRAGMKMGNGNVALASFLKVRAHD